MQAVRSEEYKLIAKHSKDAVEYELYNLDRDPGETSNIIEQNLSEAHQLKSYLTKAYEYSDRYPRKLPK